MTELFAPRRKADDRERAALIKSRVAVGDALAALYDASASGYPCPDPRCGALGAVAVGGGSWTCGTCGAKGDVIALVMAARQCGFRDACAFLETEMIGAGRGKSRCSQTGELFK